MTRADTLDRIFDCMALTMVLSLFSLIVHLLLTSFRFPFMISFIFLCGEALFGVFFLLASCTACCVRLRGTDPEIVAVEIEDVLEELI